MLIKNIRIPKGQGQRICIGDDVTIDIGKVGDGHIIKLAIDAPRSAKITVEPTAISKPVE